MKKKDIIQRHVERVRSGPIAFIDVGLRNIAVCTYYNNDSEPLISKADLLTLMDGKSYSKYEERYLVEIVHNWLGDHWDRHFRDCTMVCIEKQMTRMKSNVERACIGIQIALQMFFYERHIMGGPLVLVIAPQAWKRLSGIEIGGNNKAPIPSKHVNGEFFQSELNLDHKRNKTRAVERFHKVSEVCLAIAMIKERVSNISVDEIEAVLGAKAVNDNLERFVEEALLYRNHDKEKLAKVKLTFTHRSVKPPPVERWKDTQWMESSSSSTPSSSSSKRLKLA